MKQPVVGVFFGSRSVEHDSSIATAMAAVVKPLQLAGGYDVLPVYIAKDGHWYADKALGEEALFAGGKINAWLRTHKPVTVSFGEGLVLRQPGLFGGSYRIDIAFPVLRNEDDGVVAVCELAGLPYVGCDVATKAVATDKLLTKQVLQSAGVPVAPFKYITKMAFEADPDEWITKINRSLHYPLHIKPARVRSGVSDVQVDRPEALVEALHATLAKDEKALVEEAMGHLTDVLLPILGDDELRPALLERPGPENDGFVPASLPERLNAKAVQTGLDAYRALGCANMACIKLRVDAAGEKVYCEQIDPLPHNLHSYNWNMAGLSNVGLVTRLMDLAIERHSKHAQDAITG